MSKRKTLNILYATSECVPFTNSGGLGEVAGSLPRALNRKRNIDCRVIMPLYGQIADEFREKMTFMGKGVVGVTWRQQYMGVFSLRYQGVTYYFIDNEYYFRRDSLYGHYDDGERFAYFSKAIFEALGIIEKDFMPDIIHANDWQTAMIPVYQTSIYKRKYMKTVFSIHNVEYQGMYGTSAFEDFLGVPDDFRHVLKFGDGVNLMKGAIECANIVSTVSPTYAGELKDPAFAFGMDGTIRRNEYKLRGILNGINRQLYDPEKDPYIAAPFSKADLKGKKACKADLQKSLALPESDAMLITMVSRLVPAKGMDLLREIIDDILSKFNVQFVMLGTGDHEYEEFFHGLEARHPDQARCIIKFDAGLSHRIYAGGDLLLVPSRSEPCGLTQMIGCRYGDVPLVRRTGGLNDSITDCTLGDGNGFVFDNYDSGSLYAAMANAIERYHDKENWQKLVKYDLSLDFGWSNSASEYRAMYESMFE
ncbi:MAG: glycogen/starch synthase [Anaerovoracaceae bacterium]|nr:glycogen/starch synthase [Anaerovoracaceae bacterium]